MYILVPFKMVSVFNKNNKTTTTKNLLEEIWSGFYLKPFYHWEATYCLAMQI